MAAIWTGAPATSTCSVRGAHTGVAAGATRRSPRSLGGRAWSARARRARLRRLAHAADLPLARRGGAAAAPDRGGARAPGERAGGREHGAGPGLPRRHPRRGGPSAARSADGVPPRGAAGVPLPRGAGLAGRRPAARRAVPGARADDRGRARRSAPASPRPISQRSSKIDCVRTTMPPVATR